VTAVVARIRPLELSARAWKVRAELATVIRVSKPRSGAAAIGESNATVGPATTCQRATVVAPFQLA
jgi:hypothetical protein